jgi:hypothetical protein
MTRWEVRANPDQVILKQVDCSLEGDTLQTATLSSIIAAIVSLVVILISAYVSRLTIMAARTTLEKQQLGSMTAKLYDVRIEEYPKGMEITEALRRTQLAGDVTLCADYLNNIVSQLDKWYSSKAGFVLSRHSAQCFSELHKAIRVKAETNGMYSPEQIDRMVNARRDFRMALRADILLLFNEDVLLTEDFLED